MAAIYRDIRLDVLCHPGLPVDRVSVPGHELLRLRGSSGLLQCEWIERAMVASGEAAGLVRARFEVDDEFFAWHSAGEISCFGWVSRQERRVGPLRYVDRPGRVFLYNFHTLARFRRQGLYAALLRAVVFELCKEGADQILGEVNQRNPGSSRVMRGQGFVVVASARFASFFGGLHALVRVTRDSKASIGRLFQSEA